MLKPSQIPTGKRPERPSFAFTLWSAPHGVADRTTVYVATADPDGIGYLVHPFEPATDTLTDEETLAVGTALTSPA